LGGKEKDAGSKGGKRRPANVQNMRGGVVDLFNY